MRPILFYFAFIISSVGFGQTELRKNAIGIALVDINPIGVQYNRFFGAENHFMAHVDFSINGNDWYNKKYRIGGAYLTGLGKGFTPGISMQHRRNTHFQDKIIQKHITYSIVGDFGWTFVIKNRVSIHPNLGLGLLFSSYSLWEDTQTGRKSKTHPANHVPIDFDLSLRVNYLF